MEFQVVISVIVGIFGILGTVGFVFAQLRKGVIQELRETIVTANTEIQIQKGRSDRLEKQVEELTSQIAECSKESKIMRRIIESGEKLFPGFKVLLDEQTKEIISKLKQ